MFRAIRATNRLIGIQENRALGYNGAVATDPQGLELLDGRNDLRLGLRISLDSRGETLLETVHYLLPRWKCDVEPVSLCEGGPGATGVHNRLAILE